MKPILWLSDDGKFESRDEADVAAYEERQKNVLAWLELPWECAQPQQPAHAASIGLINMTPKWLAFFQLSQQLLNDGDVGKWKQRMIVEIDTLEQEFMGIVREPLPPSGDPFTFQMGNGPSSALVYDQHGTPIAYADHRDNELERREDAER